MRKRMNLNIIIYVNILYLLIIQFVLQVSSRSLDCTFDENFCDWNQEISDNYDWTRANGHTHTGFTGPRADHTRGGDSKGYYIYTKANYPRKNGDIAKLISPMQEPGPYCLVFWYNMYGKDIGTLNVFMVPKNTVIFTKSGDIGDRNWRNEAISYNASAKYQIVLEGIIGQDIKGDIAVDDISMTSGLCIIDCSFDSGLCHWKQDDDDDFDWTWNKGTTPTNSTGPPADHTSGQGHYIYIETTTAGKNETARITSPLQKAGRYCFSFWYYMYGEHVDTLRVFIVDEQKKTAELVKVSGNQGQEWIEKIVLINSATYFWIIIEGKVSNREHYYNGDIAVDDVEMFSCPDEQTSSALIAAYILVPVVLVALVITFLVIFWRQKVVRCLSTLNANKGHDKNKQPRSGSLFTNVTSDQHNDRQPNPDGEMSEDSEYAIVTDDRNEKEQSERSIYDNTVDAKDTKQETIEHNYDHTKSSATPVFDSTYSHVSDVTGNFESNYNTALGPHPGKISFQTDEQIMNNSYDVLNIQHSKQSLGKTLQPNMQDNQESEYDHAKAGGTDQVDLDDYSHLQR